MRNKILFIDTETGGLNPFKHDLLSVGLVVWADGQIVARKEILIKGHPRRCTEEALAVNGIDLKTHNQNALDKASAVQQIIDFLHEHFEKLPVIVAGHNVGFDIAFLRQLFLSQGLDFDQYFSHRSIDTSSILQYLGLLQNLPNEEVQRRASSDRAFRDYGIEVPRGKRHTALADAIATAQLFTRLIQSPALSGQVMG
ncbi:MAG: hypothetical protein KatS3mg029_0968 [Saprospiraceae bacterium]|nr:MAG: hypothetical protein KatS3mg029_0968 [Saprospiraceae bacterium]